jgi:hypothetical protein
MPKQVDELVKMRDVETLYELMAEHEDWMFQLDAAEGLVKLGDRRGYDFLVDASRSEEREVREVASEILDSPALSRMRDEVEAARRRQHEERLDTARKRLQKGSPVFRYKMMYLPAVQLLSDEEAGSGYEVPELDEAGLEGWEVVNMLTRRNAVIVGSADEHFIGAYFLLKREVRPEDDASLL